MPKKHRSPMQQELLQRRRTNSLTPNVHLLPSQIHHDICTSQPLLVPSTPTTSEPSPGTTQQSEQPSTAAAPDKAVDGTSRPPRQANDVRAAPNQQPTANEGSAMCRYLREQRRMARRPKQQTQTKSSALAPKLPLSQSPSPSPSPSIALPPVPPAPNLLTSSAEAAPRRKPSYSPAARTFSPPMTTSYGTALRRYKALLIGIGYRGHRFLKPLAGCCTDVLNMYALLTGPCFQFPQANIHVLCDELDALGESVVDKPTRINIIRELTWLTKGISRGDSVIFFFAGHGDFVVDLSGDEIETGFDQCIMPMDYEKPALHGAGKLPRGATAILDDQIYERLVRCVPDGAKVTALVDACRSGTVCDLPVQYDDDGQVVIRNQATGPPRLRNQHHLAAGGFVLFSGCSDSQFSADMTLPDGKTSCGIMTKSFVDAVNEMTSQRTNASDAIETWTYGMLMMRVRQLVTFWAKQVVGDHAAIQEPQLSSSHALNIWHTPFSM